MTPLTFFIIQNISNSTTVRKNKNHAQNKFEVRNLKLLNINTYVFVCKCLPHVYKFFHVLSQ